MELETDTDDVDAMIELDDYSGTLTEAMVLSRTRASDLENVKKINCWSAGLIDISILTKMPHLEVCSLSVNQVSSLTHFSSCPQLQELYIRKNNISDLREICHLKCLKKLRVLWLSDNPCAGADNYRMTVLRNLPHLHKLDNKGVTEDEVTAAVDQGELLDLPADNMAPMSELMSMKAVPEQLSKKERMRDAITLSLDETNKIRAELGLKLLPADKMTHIKTIPSSSSVNSASNILKAILLLVKELDKDALQTLANDVKQRIESCT